MALVLVIEGMLPFVSPRKYREMVVQIAQLDENHIRTIGLVIMIIGLLTLFLIRS